MIPRAFIGSAEGGGIYALSQGYRDGDSPVEMVAQGNPVAPGGADNDCVFNRIFLTLTSSMQVTLTVVPVVDGVEISDAAFTVELTALPTAERTSHVFERSLYQWHRVNGVQKYKKGLRGTWFDLRISSSGGIGSGDLIFDEVVLDYDVESPTKEQVT